MRRASRSAFFVLLSLAFVSMSGCIIETSGDPDASLTIANESDFVIDELRVTEAGNPDYGPNLVGSQLLYPGEEITVLVDCGFYDVLVVDETGFGCELLDLDLCFEDALWVIDNSTLATCDF